MSEDILLIFVIDIDLFLYIIIFTKLKTQQNQYNVYNTIY